ncbi:hypothetical protein [Ruegeria atlantica]|uniref:hypothetical protein n=1 Tax=Ruegeria atlantica TaxID=81569 RepID=UPI002494CFEA|nr:hypothetical protein [Ruegeria atlantica]
MKSFFKRLAQLSILCVASTPAYAQSDAAQANNPLADITAFNIQNYYIGDFTGPANATGNQFVLRYAKPVTLGSSNWLIRASLPFNSLPVGTDGQTLSGVGDFDVFAAYQFNTGNPGISFALGPQVVVPTASDDRLGADQWQLGLANVYFNATSPVFQYGYLLTWRGGVGDTNGRPRANLGAFQPFVFYQLGSGYYTGGAPIWTYNFVNDSYSVPLGIRLGKVTKRGNTVYNFFVEPQYSVFDKGIGLPKWQIYAALNMQFQ